MHKFFVQKDNIYEDCAKIIGDDVKHIYKVLRLKENEDIIINDMNGNEYLSKIKQITKSEVEVQIIEKLEINNESPVKIYLFQGMPKAQKMDLIVQKATELGVTKVIPVITERVDVKLKGEFKKIDRLNRIALEAAKQSKRSILLTVDEPIEFKEIFEITKNIDLFIVPYENAENFGVKSLMKSINNKKDIKSVAIFIGPEGGFENNEIEILKENGAKIITLGKRILRTETAGFVTASLIQYELGDLGGY